MTGRRTAASGATRVVGAEDPAWLEVAGAAELLDSVGEEDSVAVRELASEDPVAGDAADCVALGLATGELRTGDPADAGVGART